MGNTEEKESTEVAISEQHLLYKKSNEFIEAIYKWDLLQLKLFAIALAHTENMRRDENGLLVSSFNMALVKEYIPVNSGSSYSKIKDAVEDMGHKGTGIRNEEDDYRSWTNIFASTVYNQGNIQLYFNPQVEEYVFTPGRYSLLDLYYSVRFKNDYAYRLYELLRARAYERKNESYDKELGFRVRIDYNELLIKVGLIDPDEKGNEKMRKPLSNAAFSDYEKAVEVAKSKKYKVWYDFDRYILKKAVAEINEITNMRVEYEPIKSGKGGKVTGVEFIVRYVEEKKEIEEKPRKISQEEMDSFCDYISSRLIETGCPVTFSSIGKLAEAASYNREVFDKALEVMIGSKGTIENPVGFLVAAMKNGYESASPFKGKGRVNSFNAFEQRKMTSAEKDELERRMEEITRAELEEMICKNASEKI